MMKVYHGLGSHAPEFVTLKFNKGVGALYLKLDIILVKISCNQGCLSGPGNVCAYIIWGCENLKNWEKKGCGFGQGHKFQGEKNYKAYKNVPWGLFSCLENTNCT